MEKEFIYEGFAELEEAGFESEYVEIDHSQTPSIIRPAFTLDHLLNNCGFHRKGTKLRYLGENGYDSDRFYAEKQGLIKDETYTLKKTSVGSWSSSIYLEEVEGSFNSVMFKVVDEHNL